MGAVVKPVASIVTPVTSALGITASIGSSKSATSTATPAATAPTTAEVSQATTTDAMGSKRRRRGRSPTILTGAEGVQAGATLGTPTLLG